ncbi:aldo/keto reductase [Dyadobacter tibetensis]|uniref:aldo/keto reductase n=1 Tax=Dyadobacter tibetensis TaxID=1211851 RepID=UPI00046F3DC9|nr:aldo/keto reductase [Dyadobacter tibetensis]
MLYRKLSNKSDSLELSVITYGAFAAGGWMWGGTERKEAVESILKSYDAGVTSIDTAPVYGQGLSEEIVGEAIRDIPRDKVQILTKYGMRWDLKKGDFAMHSKDNDNNDLEIYKYAGKESVIKECEDSLRRLKVDYIDLYQIHWPESTTPIQETMEAVDQLIQQGKVRFAGVCNYNVEQLKEASKYVDIVSDQVAYSMLRKDIEADTIPYCLETKKGILAYSPMERGLLTGKIKAGHQFEQNDHRAKLPFYQEGNLQKINAFLDKIRPIAEEKNASLGQLVLRWTAEQPGITIVLAGARNASQAVQNAEAMNIDLSADELATIDGHLNELSLTR